VTHSYLYSDALYSLHVVHIWRMVKYSYIIKLCIPIDFWRENFKHAKISKIFTLYLIKFPMSQ